MYRVSDKDCLLLCTSIVLYFQTIFHVSMYFSPIFPVTWMESFTFLSRNLRSTWSALSAHSALPYLRPSHVSRRGKADFLVEERLWGQREGEKKIKTRARKVQEQQFELTSPSLSLASLNPCLFTKCRQSVSCGVKLGRVGTNGATAETRASCHATRGRERDKEIEKKREDKWQNWC